jgi:hypothetical protein
MKCGDTQPTCWPQIPHQYSEQDLVYKEIFHIMRPVGLYRAQPSSIDCSAVNVPSSKRHRYIPCMFNSLLYKHKANKFAIKSFLHLENIRFRKEKYPHAAVCDPLRLN